MKIRGLFWVWLWVAASVRGDWPARVHFLNGDTLSGEVTGISGDEIRFRAGRSDGEVRVPAEAVAEIRGLAPQGGVGEPVHEVLPHAGGRLRVSVEEAAGADMLVRMPWGQAVRLPRARIAEVRDVSGTRPLPVEKTLNNILPNGMQFRRPEIAEQTFEGLRVGRGWRAAYQLPADLSASFLLQVQTS